MSIGRNISELRREKGLTQQQLAEKLGVSGQSVSKWENDVCAPDVGQFPLLAELFGVSIDRLYGFRLSDGEEEQAIVDKADKLDSLEENIAFLKENLEKYPNSSRLKTALAMSWLSLSWVRDYTKKPEEAAEARDQCVRLCREVVRSCGDRGQVDEALELLRRASMAAGEIEQALGYLEQLSPEAWQLRIIGKAQTLLQRGDAELERFGQRELLKLWLTMDQLISFLVSGYCPRDARRALAFAEIRETLLTLFDRVSPDFYASRKFIAADTQAKLLRAAEAKEECLAALRRQMARGLECQAVARLEDHRIGTRNWLFFDRLKEYPEMQEEWVTISDLSAYLTKYEEFFGENEDFQALKKKMERPGKQDDTRA